MRLSRFTFLAGAAALVRGQSLDENYVTTKKPTVFNDVTVPPLLELTPLNFEEEVTKTKYLMVKHYSPHCRHCIDYAPTFQTAYEFYYTSHPEGAPDASFLEYYDFRFGMINCVAYGDLCLANGVTTFPVTTLFENGKPVDSIRGVRSIEQLSVNIETALEKAKPGSRPKTILLPEAGDDRLPKGAADKKPDKGSETLNGEESQKKLSQDELPAKKSADKAADKSGKPPPRVFDKNWKSPTSAELFNSKKLKKPTATPNQNGVSISLTPESFQRMVTMTQDPWFIKFYAPWCHHCQAMAPTWDQLAKTMRGKLNVGEVNCEKESRLCKDVGARSYPTILFFKGGERAEYRGLRGLGDFVQYADSAMDLAGGVPDVDAQEFAALEEKEDVIFVYFYDHATTTEDFMALERIPLSLIGHAKLVKTNDPALYERFKIHTFPRLLVSREGRPTYYTPLTPDAIRDVRGVLDWMRSVWLPLVPELTAANARQIMDGKVVVLGILNRENEDSFQGALRELKTAANEWMDRQIQEFQLERKKLRDAKQMRVEEARDRDDERALRAAKAIRIDMDQSGRKEVGFAWVDGVFWQRWIRTTFGIDVSDGERVIINDQDSRKYWDQTITGNYIMVSRTAISESLDRIIYGPNTIPYKLTTSLISKIFHDMGVAFVEHPFVSAGCVVGFCIAAYMWFRRRARRSRGGYFNLEDKMGGLGSFRDGLLGHNNGNTKAD